MYTERKKKSNWILTKYQESICIVKPCVKTFLFCFVSMFALYWKAKTSRYSINWNVRKVWALFTLIMHSDNYLYHMNYERSPDHIIFVEFPTSTHFFTWWKMCASFAFWVYNTANTVNIKSPVGTWFCSWEGKVCSWLICVWPIFPVRVPQ